MNFLLFPRIQSRWIPAVAAALALAGAHPATARAADRPATAIDASLTPARVHVLEAGPQRVRLRDAARPDQLPRDDTADRWLRFTFDTPANAPAPEPAPALVVLTDGQRLPGELLGPDPQDPDRLHFALAHFDPDPAPAVAIPVARIAAIRYDTTTTPSAEFDPHAAPPADDQLWLRNGERLEGFIEFTADGLTLSVQGAPPIALAGDVLAAVRLANPPAARRPEAARLTFRHGAALDTNDWALQPGRLRFALLTGPGPDDLQPLTGASLAFRTPADQLAQLDLAATGRSLAPWSTLDYEVTQGGAVFGAPFPPRFDAQGRLRANAPVALRFAAPPGLAAIAGVVRLDLQGANETARKLAGVTVVIAPVSRADQPSAPEPWTAELTAEEPQARFRLDLTRDWTVRLETGRGGPIYDRVVFESPQALIRQPPPE
ncbi:MAG: hypothetical protein AAGA57_02745 [Planctomycetota bacterium]